MLRAGRWRARVSATHYELADGRRVSIGAEETRDMLAFLLRVTRANPGPHIGPVVLPPLA